MNNPFNITKAVDYSDVDIIRYWVDISDGFKNLLKPTSPMPMLVLGSKGSGKTHLMRYFSYYLQKIRTANIEESLKSEKYIGVYFRCGGLNSDKFRGKGQSEEIWNSVFSYYLELWIGQLLLNILDDLNLSLELQKEICNEILHLFEKDISEEILDIKSLNTFLRNKQKIVDYEVNNCAISRTLINLEILLSPGKLTFGIPKIVREKVDFLNETIFLYLIDEFENISSNQQKLINTLYREKEPFATFRIGARLYGIRTYSTLGGEEDNKEGSEFEKVILDDFFRTNSTEYEKFVKEICFTRLNEEGFNIPKIEAIDSYFEEFNLSNFLEKIKKGNYRNVHLDRLEKKLSISKYVPADQIKLIIGNLTFENDLLIEKANVFAFYREWSKKKGALTNASYEIKKDANDFVNNEHKKGNKVANVLEYFKKDLIDQLARDSREKIPYYGFKRFIDMSSGVPRNLLNILKHIYRWSYFNDEIKPFKLGKISLDAQNKGVNETADWFFEDNRVPAVEGKQSLEAIRRLGRFLQDIRFSDLPPECSLCAIKIGQKNLDDTTNKIIDFLEKYSFIIERDKAREKNSNEYLRTLQINGVAAPAWDLPIYRRGIIELNKIEINIIFGSVNKEKYESFLSEKLEKYNAPFFGLTTQTLFENE